MKKALIIIPSIFFLLFFLRYGVFVPKYYHTALPECTEAQTFDLSQKGTAHLSALKTILKTKTPEQYRYLFKTFLEEEKTYMVVNFRNESECFDVKMLVNNWDILTGMRIANGKCYPKELYDLKWEVKEIDGIEEVLYTDMHAIID